MIFKASVFGCPKLVPVNETMKQKTINDFKKELLKWFTGVNDVFL
jgi:hypothetical protein